MSDLSNQEILLALQQENIEKPVAMLYRTYHGTVQAMVLAQGGTAADADDVFQDAMLCFVNTVKAGKFRGDSSIKTFYVSIARHIWFNELRSRQRRENRHQQVVQLSDQVVVEMPAQALANSSESLQNVFDQIGDVCKRILIGFYYKQLNMRQLLQQFDFENEQVLRNKKSKCLKKVKEIIAVNPALAEALQNQLYHE
jgi:RNA polymerase sigma factor (sigma-70 family)